MDLGFRAVLGQGLFVVEDRLWGLGRFRARAFGFSLKLLI